MGKETPHLELSPLINSKCINEEWIAKMLSLYFGYQIILLSFHCSLPEGRSGFLSEIIYVSVSYKLDNEEKKEILVFKLLPTEEEAKLFVQNGGLAKREAGFYKFAQSEEFQAVCIRNGSSLVIPDVLYCQLSETAFTLVLRDLKTKNYKTLMPRDGSCCEHILRAFTSAAIVHTAGLCYYENHGHFGVCKHGDNSFMEEILEINLLKLSKLFEGNHLAKIFLKLIPFKKDIVQNQHKHPLFETVIHGDLWAGQCMFSEDESEVCVFDWQFSNVGNPVLDIMGMLFMSSDPVVLENHCEEVLSHYWKQLTNNINKNNVKFEISFSDFLENIEKHWMTGFHYIAVSLTDFLGADNISTKRLNGLMHFLDRKNVFNNFIKEIRISL